MGCSAHDCLPAIGPVSRKCLENLTSPVPEATLAGWLVEAFVPLRPPPDKLLLALAEWLAARTGFGFDRGTLAPAG